MDNVFHEGMLHLDGAVSVTTAIAGGMTYLFVVGQNADGVSVFRVGDGGLLANVHNVPDAGSLQLNGAVSVTTAEIAGTTYLFVAGSLDDGVSVFSVANDGMLSSVQDVDDDDDDLQLAGAFSVTTAVVGTTTYLFVAGSLDDGVSVFSVANDGMLSSVQDVDDDDDLQLDGAFSVTTAVAGGTTYLFVAGNKDDGVSVFRVANDGMLSSVAGCNRCR